MIRLTDEAGAALRPGEVVFVDWHATGLCCADAGEFSVRAIQRSRLSGDLRDLDGQITVHPMAWLHLARLDVLIDCRTYGGRVIPSWRRFTTDLPSDAGLRACLGRLEGHEEQRHSDSGQPKAQPKGETP